MRSLARAVGLSFALIAGAAAAQDLSPSLPGPDAPALQDPSAIRNATVIERRSLPPQLRVQVDSAVAQAKGMNSAAVIAVPPDEDGDLTLIAEEGI